MEKKIVVITGANTGIGYEAVKALLQSTQPYHIFLSSRSVEKGNAAASQLRQEVPESPSSIEVLQVDLVSDDSINAAFARIQNGPGRIDALVNNAGLTYDPLIGKEMTMREAWNGTYDINVTGTQVLTHVLAPLLLKSTDARLVFLTSGLSSLVQFDEAHYPGPAPEAKGWPKPPRFGADAYRTSKTALNVMMLTWHYNLRPDGVKVWSVSPGFLATGLGGNPDGLKAMGAGHPSVGGMLLRDVLEGKRDTDVGKVVNGHGIQPF